jgi:hypothetical protein
VGGFLLKLRGTHFRVMAVWVPPTIYTVCLGQRMSKKDFAAKRRAEARALSKLNDHLVKLFEPVATSEGKDLRALLDEAATLRAERQQQLAERLTKSVLPLFTDDQRGKPDRIGSCVLVRLDSSRYIFTAAHVIRDAGSAPLWVPCAEGSRTRLKLSRHAAHLTPELNPLDVGIFLLHPSVLSAFEGRVFLADRELDLDGLPDDQSLGSFYYVIGYSASRTQVKVSHERRQVNQKLFHCTTSVVEADEYLQEHVSQSDHVLLDFDHNEISVKGEPRGPLKLKGVSGGGIFYISRNTMLGPLIGIAMENPRKSRIIVGTRLKHFLVAARALRASILSDIEL